MPRWLRDKSAEITEEVSKEWDSLKASVDDLTAKLKVSQAGREQAIRA